MILQCVFFSLAVALNTVIIHLILDFSDDDEHSAEGYNQGPTQHHILNIIIFLWNFAYLQSSSSWQPLKAAVSDR